MNPTEIANSLDTIAMAPFDAAEFGYSFAEATDNAQATIARLRLGTINKSDLPGGVLLNRKFHYVPSESGATAEMMETVRASRKTISSKPAILLVTDGETIAAEHPASGEVLHCQFTELGTHFAFFLPAAGKERYKAAEENPVDIKAAGKLAKLYDALMRTNPDWSTLERRHDMNLFMTRLIFCLFSEDVGIFTEGQFSHAVFTYGGNKGEHARDTIVAAFQAMNLPKGSRGALPRWVGDFEYVNGGLFAGLVDAPVFNQIAFRYLRDACELKWKLINPDIFGSMIQSIADPDARSELGMHYTSVPNIMKVLGPLFLDDLDAAIEKAWNKPGALRTQLTRLSNIRVFDPACGSGNFLVVSYRELREREIIMLKRLGELEANAQNVLWSSISLGNFHGIELTDFAAETAKLALFIAEYQANARFADVFGRMPALLPLRDGGHIVTGNSLRLDWDAVCPPPAGTEEVYIVGNPPFLGKARQDAAQKADMDHVFAGRATAFRALDLVAAWYFKAADYIRGRRAMAALVSTNSICQGASAASLWPDICREGVEIGFAHRSFKWRNNAAANAAVFCVVVGLRNMSGAPRRLFDNGISTEASNINAYLVDGPPIHVSAISKSINGLPEMTFGEMPRDGGHLILSPHERDQLIDKYPAAERFVRKFLGSEEVVNGSERYCLWIDERAEPDAIQAALTVPPIRARLENVAENRRSSTNPSTNEFADRPHRFVERRSPVRYQHAILVPSVTSERRPYLPVARVGADVISSNLNQVLYDAPDWCIALIASKLHIVWIGTVCGRLESRYRYSNTLGWNTFPVPKFTSDQLDQLSASARRILKTRYSHYPATIADLYDPDSMPADLREAHLQNDELLESMYIGRPFRNDTERLEKLFKLYAAKVKEAR